MHATSIGEDQTVSRAWISDIAHPPDYSSTSLRWRHVEAYRYNGLRCHELVLPSSEWHFIAIHLMRPCTVTARWSGRPVSGRSVPGNIMVMSAGQDSTWHCSNAIDELLLFLDPQIVTEAAQDAGVSEVRLIDGVGLVSPALQTIALQLLSELEAPDLGTRVFADALARAIALELVRRHSTARSAGPPSGLKLSARQLRAATEFIDAHIDRDLSLDAIACCAAMSSFRFSRGFRNTTGLSPWKYVILRRIERAKQLLRGSRHNLTEIAAMTGFSTQSHFTDAFRRHCGATPKRYRDSKHDSAD